ncbi:MAG: copper chaperone PCu(A)C [Terriglobia bacterium]
MTAPVFAAAPAGVSIEQPRMRLIIKNRPAAGYFTIKNRGTSPVKLTGASSIGCGMVMLHQSKEENGVDKMLPVESVMVPAHGSVSFAPGGYHLMCMKPQSAMQVGHDVPVTLKFANGDSLTTQFLVRGASGK